MAYLPYYIWTKGEFADEMAISKREGGRTPDDLNTAATKRILVVEDEVVVGENLRDLLRDEGYEVPEVCVSGEEALKEVEKTRPHLLLMDIRLKGKLDGIETVIQAERLEPKRFSVVFLTAHSQNQFPHIAEVKSRYSYLTKPYSSRALLETVKELLHTAKQ